MRIFQVFGRFFRRSAAEVKPASTTDMTALAEKLAAKRGDNVNIGSAQPGTNAAERLAENADMAGFVTSTREDDIISG